jgi:methionyl-tRNA formyltransferase
MRGITLAPVRIVFAGTPQVAVPSLEALLASDHDVVAVLTRPDAPSGRGKKLTPSPVAERAAELGIETLKPTRLRDPEFCARFAEIAPDCCPVVAYGALLPQSLLDLPRLGWVNLHFSLLPAWRGAAPVQHAVLAGDEVTGATTFQIVAELDAGPIFATITEPIAPTDTSGDLLRRLSISGAGLLVRTLDGIADGSLTAYPQGGEGVTMAPKITVDDARLDWIRPAEVLDRVVRGCAPAPGAWTTFRGDRFKINSGTPVSDHPGSPGELAVTKRSVVVAACEGSGLVLGQVQAQGKKPMLAADWARGVTFEPGEALGG